MSETKLMERIKMIDKLKISPEGKFALESIAAYEEYHITFDDAVKAILETEKSHENQT